MNKKLITALVASIIMSSFTVAKAADNSMVPTVAILDTALDSSIPALQGRIVQEVCLINWTTCPNGKSYMEGPGAAGMPESIIFKSGFEHGTQMTSIFAQNNPNVNIVFIKIIGNTATGGRQLAPESAVYNALNWVIANKAKYNIQAVTMSQGHHNLVGTGTDYCPKTPNTENAIKELISIGVPTFFPSGNGRDYKRIDWPACIDSAVSVGAVDQQNEIAAYSNVDAEKLDFFALGNMQATSPTGIVKNVAGTSASAQVAAAQYMAVKAAKPNLSVDQIISLMKDTSVNTIGRQGTFKKLIDIVSATRSTPVVSGPTPEQIAAQKAAVKAEVDKAIAQAEAQYQIELKAAQDKLAATKAQWMAKLNG